MHNLEIKARALDWAVQIKRAAAIADGPPTVLLQVDTFFCVPRGRLKLREFDDGTGELIQYERPDTAGPRQSSYVRALMTQPAATKVALAAALSVRAVVTKKRTLFIVEQTRIHMDEVKDLGAFIELEVVLHASQAAADGEAIAQRLMEQLGIDRRTLIAEAYVDLLLRSGAQTTSALQSALDIRAVVFGK